MNKLIFDTFEILKMFLQTDMVGCHVNNIRKS